MSGGQPPGRAGRLWLVRRLAVADRGAEVLDRKLRILRHEQERLRLLEARTSREWTASCLEARRWLERAVVLGGQRGLERACPEQVADVQLAWRYEMGVRYAEPVACDLPEPLAAGAPPGSAALVEAERAHRAAAQAAVRHACAQAALRTIEAEVASTHRRWRALTHRVVPDLRARLAQVVLSLEQLEREDTLRLRWAAGRGASSDRSPG